MAQAARTSSRASAMSGALTEATLPVVISRTWTAPGTRAEAATNCPGADAVADADAVEEVEAVDMMRCGRCLARQLALAEPGRQAGGLARGRRMTRGRTEPPPPPLLAMSVKALVDTAIKNEFIIAWSKQSCPFCTRAKTLLGGLSLPAGKSVKVFEYVVPLCWARRPRSHAEADRQLLASQA